jgi:hypothetical protein
MSSFYKPDDPVQKPGHDSDKITFLNLAMKPGKVDYVRAGYILDMQPSAIRTLVSLGVLKPLGKNGKTEHKYFSTPTIVRYANDEKWMDQAMCLLQDHWSDKNSQRQSASSEENKKRSPRSFGLGNGRKRQRICIPSEKAKKVPRPPPDPRAM